MQSTNTIYRIQYLNKELKLKSFILTANDIEEAIQWFKANQEYILIIKVEIDV
jgi:hypothetical protein